jgi:YD repeat-containing protein
LAQRLSDHVYRADVSDRHNYQRVEPELLPDTEEVMYTYDETDGENHAVGRLTTMADAVEWTTYRYDRRGGLLASLGTDLSVSFGYDAAGNRTTIVYPSGRVVSYAYDFAGRPLSAWDDAGTFVSSASYLPFGPMTSLVYGNGTTKSMAYDSRYRPTENSLNTSSSTLADYVYQYDATGNITEIHDAISSAYNRDFGYDDLNRLTVANSGSALWGSGSYTYDPRSTSGRARCRSHLSARLRRSRQSQEATRPHRPP